MEEKNYTNLNCKQKLKMVKYNGVCNFLISYEIDYYCNKIKLTDYKENYK